MYIFSYTDIITNVFFHMYVHNTYIYMNTHTYVHVLVWGYFHVNVPQWFYPLQTWKPTGALGKPRSCGLWVGWIWSHEHHVIWRSPPSFQVKVGTNQLAIFEDHADKPSDFGSGAWLHGAICHTAQWRWILWKVEVSTAMGVPPARCMVFVRKNPNLRWI